MVPLEQGCWERKKPLVLVLSGDDRTFNSSYPYILVQGTIKGIQNSGRGVN